MKRGRENSKNFRLNKKSVVGSGQVDIIVTTPFRVVEHIRNTPGFTLEHLEYLVISAVVTGN